MPKLPKTLAELKIPRQWSLTHDDEAFVLHQVSLAIFLKQI